MAITLATEKKESVGLVGVGPMGRCMLTMLLEAGYPVSAFDPSPTARAFIIGQGGNLCSDPIDVAHHSTRIFMSLPMPANILETITAMLDVLTPDLDFPEFVDRPIRRWLSARI